MFKNKTLLITGGTGSFGNAILRRFLSTDIKEIRVFSRNELKQDNMRKLFNNSKLKFYIGDVRDTNSIDDAMNSVDFVFHAAALKQVPSCEFYPMQAVKTNVIGTENVLHVAIGAEEKLLISKVNELQHAGLRITNLGELPRETVLSKYNECRALIYPSLRESFGLPLVEASRLGVPILASELDYVYDVCTPVMTFNPMSFRTMSRAIKRFLGVVELATEISSPDSFLDYVISGGKGDFNDG